MAKLETERFGSCQIGHRDQYLWPMTGEQIRALRKAKGLEQQWVAERAGLTKQQLSRIEGGSRNLLVAEFAAIARAMGEKPGDLLPNSSGPAPELAALAPVADVLSRVPADQWSAVVAALTTQAQAIAAFLPPAPRPAPRRGESTSAEEIVNDFPPANGKRLEASRDQALNASRKEREK